MKPIAISDTLNHVDSSNREDMFKKACAELEQRDDNGKVSQETKRYMKVTHKVLMETDKVRKDVLSINCGKVFPVNETRKLRKKQFWWPCRHDGSTYVFVGSMWLLGGLSIAGTEMHKASPFYVPISDDSIKFIKGEADQFGEKFKGSDSSDITVAYLDAHLGLDKAMGIFSEYDIEDEGYMWKALELAYLAGCSAAVADLAEQGTFDLARRGYKFPVGRPPKTSKNLKKWEAQAIEILKGEDQPTWSMVQDRLVEGEWLERCQGYEQVKATKKGNAKESQDADATTEGKPMSNRTFQNRLSKIRKVL